MQKPQVGTVVGLSPDKIEVFIERMKGALNKHLPNGDESSKYCRSGCSFGWNLWKDANNLKLKFISENISNECISNKFLKLLNSLI